MFGSSDDSKQSSRFTVTPMFDNYSSELPFPRWSNAPAERNLLSRAPYSLNGPLPMPKRIPVSRKYSHVQSKISQLWQDQPTSLAPRKWQSTILPALDNNKKPAKISSKTKREIKEVELSRVREDVVQLAIGVHIRRLSQAVIRSPSVDEEENLLENLKCEVFGIKDYLNAGNSDKDDGLGDMGRALETKPPEVLDCHMSEMLSGQTPPELDDIRTPTPDSDVNVDGFPDECVDTDDSDAEENGDEQMETKKETATPLESERSGSEASLNFTNASVDSIADSELIAKEPLEIDSDSLLIDNADALLKKLSVNNLQGQVNGVNGVNGINGDDEFDNGDEVIVAPLRQQN